LECGAPAPLFKGDATKEGNRRKKRKKTKKRSGSGGTWGVNVSVIHASP
jgi:hypothetical protein